MDDQFSLQTGRQDDGVALVFGLGEKPFVSLPQALAIETVRHGAIDPVGKRSARAYETVERAGAGLTGIAAISDADTHFRLIDRWTPVDAKCWRVERRLEIVRAGEVDGVRLILELAPALAHSAYGDFRYFAPPALYDLNDLNDDGVEDYLETRSLHFRDDRLNLLSLLAYSEHAGAGLALSRADLPKHDSLPERRSGESAFLQATDIGSLGIEPAGEGVRLVAAYPFAERTRSHALLVKQRAPFAAFHPVMAGTVLSVAYLLRVVIATDVHAAVGAIWRRRLDELRPRPVALPQPVGDLAGLRLEALERYYIEEKDGDRAAGFVTNCHPQDGRQLSNVIQFGFTGQNNLNAFNLLRAADREGNGDRRAKALRVFDFFVRTAERSPFGLIPGYYNADTREFGSWWTGLILPLAYADPGADLEKLMARSTSSSATSSRLCVGGRASISAAWPKSMMRCSPPIAMNGSVGSIALNGAGFACGSRPSWWITRRQTARGSALMILPAKRLLRRRTGSVKLRCRESRRRPPSFRSSSACMN